MKTLISKKSKTLAVGVHKNTMTTKTVNKTTQMTAVFTRVAQAKISTDPLNRLTKGTDDGLYVSNDLTPDPLAYYILAKA